MVKLQYVSQYQISNGPVCVRFLVSSTNVVVCVDDGRESISFRSFSNVKSGASYLGRSPIPCAKTKMPTENDLCMASAYRRPHASAVLTEFQFKPFELVLCFGVVCVFVLKFLFAQSSLRSFWAVY